MHECCCIDAGDYPEFISEKMVVARKIHKCNECGGDIWPGEKYEYVAGRWPDGFEVFKTCKICAKIRKDMFTCGYTYGYLKEELYECHGVIL